jgi:tRNA modification GTPase
LPVRAEPGQFWLGKFGEEIADEGVLTVKHLEPVPLLELHLHGGQEVIRCLQETLEARGIRRCGWQELGQRTMEDPSQAAALAALAEAPTARTASILLDQVHGSFGRAIEAVRAALLQDDLHAAIDRLNALTRHSSLGCHLTKPWRVVIAGAPNVGKSSLVNAFAGFQRSVVAATPGTTRDVVWTRLAIDGWPVEVADTAGLRTTSADLEGAGVALAHGAIAAADLCLWVLDAASSPVWPDLSGPTLHFVLNKTDLAPAWDLSRAAGALRVSALTRAGLAGLCEAISRCLVPDPPAAGVAVPFTPAICQRLDDVGKALAARQKEVARQLLLELWNDMRATWRG